MPPLQARIRIRSTDYKTAILEFTPPRAIEYRHVIAAIPGDTLRQKMDWVQAQVLRLSQDTPPTCDCGGGCCCDPSASSGCDKDADAAARAMSKAIGDIEAVIAYYQLSAASIDAMNKIIKIVDGVE